MSGQDQVRCFHNRPSLVKDLSDGSHRPCIYLVYYIPIDNNYYAKIIFIIIFLRYGGRICGKMEKF